MLKPIAGTILLICHICASYALECYTCADCHSGNVDKQYCPSGELQCGKLTLSVELGEQKKTSTIKACLPPIRVDCKTYVKETLRNSGDVAPQYLDTMNSLIDLPGLNVECNSCKSDLCNSSSLLYPSSLTFILLLIISRIY